MSSKSLWCKVFFGFQAKKIAVTVMVLAVPLAVPSVALVWVPVASSPALVALRAAVVPPVLALAALAFEERARGQEGQEKWRAAAGVVRLVHHQFLRYPKRAAFHQLSQLQQL